MTIPELHLAAEAVAAYVDGELAAVPGHRAEVHLATCPECRRAVVVQRHAKRVLHAAGEPAPSADLLAKLRGIPQTADLGTADMVFAVEGSQLVWGTAHAAARPAGDGSRTHRAWSFPHPSFPHPHRGPRSQRLSRSLAGAAAGIAVGMLASFSPTGAAAGAGSAGGSSVVAPGGSAGTAGTATAGIGTVPNRPLRVPATRDVMTVSFAGQR